MSLLFSKKQKMKCHELSGAKKYLQHIRCNLKLPKKAIVCPLSSLTKYALSQGNFKHYWCEADIYVEEKKGFCYVTGAGIGAPAMATTLEILIALGVKEFVMLGLAGSLQPEVLAGDIVLCDGALADEGTSAHYLPQEKQYPSKSLLTKLSRTLDKEHHPYHVGPNWSTDALFRETVEEVAHYQKKNILTVEMETAAAYAVCTHKKVKCAAAYVISDELFNLKWEPHFGEKAVVDNLHVLYHAVIKTLLSK